MKRDMDLIRRIALAVADLPHASALERLDGVDEALLFEHAKLMQEAGLIEATLDTYVDGTPAGTFIHRLTWEGQNFVNEVENDTLWAKAKQSVIKPGASFTFGLLRDWLKHEIQQGFPTLR